MLKEEYELHTGQKVNEVKKVLGGKYKSTKSGTIQRNNIFINKLKIESDIKHDSNLPKAY